MTEHLRETTVESVQVYEGVFLRVRKDVARLPDGSDHPREWVMHPGAAAMAALGDDGRLLMVRQWRYPMRQAYLEIPAGKIDPGGGATSGPAGGVPARERMINRTRSCNRWRRRSGCPSCFPHPPVS